MYEPSASNIECSTRSAGHIAANIRKRAIDQADRQRVAVWVTVDTRAVVVGDDVAAQAMRFQFHSVRHRSPLVSGW